MSAYAAVSVLVVLSNILATATFMIYYHVRTRGGWRKLAAGWHIMSLTANDWLLFSMLLAQGLFPVMGAAGWYRWAYIAVVWGVTPITVWRSLMLRRVQAEAVDPAPVDLPG